MVTCDLIYYSCNRLGTEEGRLPTFTPGILKRSPEAEQSLESRSPTPPHTHWEIPSLAGAGSHVLAWLGQEGSFPHTSPAPLDHPLPHLTKTHHFLREASSLTHETAGGHTRTS